MHAKSISNGNGDARYTTFIKIWKTGVLDVDENRVLTISRRKNYLRDDESFVGERAREDLFGQDRKGKIKRLYFVIESTERQFPRHSLGGCSAAREISNSQLILFVHDGFPVAVPSGFEFQ